MKIFQIIYALSSGGAERVVLNLSNELVKDNEVYIVCIQELEGRNNFYQNALDEGVQLISLGNRKGNSLRAFFQVFKLIKQYKPDVVHAHLNTLLYCFLPSLFLVKKVKYFHTLHNLAEESVGFRWQKLINKFFYRDKIKPIAISQTCARSFREYYNFPSVYIIENSVPRAV